MYLQQSGKFNGLPKLTSDLLKMTTTRIQIKTKPFTFEVRAASGLIHWLWLVFPDIISEYFRVFRSISHFGRS